MCNTHMRCLIPSMAKVKSATLHVRYKATELLVEQRAVYKQENAQENYIPERASLAALQPCGISATQHIDV
jgi:hypothetical protein